MDNDEITGQRIDSDTYGLHLDAPDADLLGEDLDGGLRDNTAADLLDAVAGKFNARDLDGLLELMAPDVETPGVLVDDATNLPEAVESLWQRRPACLLTRGVADNTDVGVLWDHDGQQWWRIAAVHLADITDGVVGVLEISDDQALLDQATAEPPAVDEVTEGTTWHEWEDGVDDN